MNSSKAKSCLALLFWITSSFWVNPPPATALENLPPNNIVLVPGGICEKYAMSNAYESWVDNGARVTIGFFEYRLPLHTRSPFVLDFDGAGPCIVEVSLGGELWSQVFSSGLEPGQPKDHIRRQIRIEQPPNNPFLVRFTRPKGASSPFYLLRFSVLRQLELYPGSATELSRLRDPGSSTIPNGGGRLIPAGTSISYSLSDSPETKLSLVVENEGEVDVAIDGIALPPLRRDGRLSVFECFAPNPESTLRLTALTSARLIRTSFFYSTQNIDPTSEFGKIMGSGKTGTLGTILEDGFSLSDISKGQIFSAFASNPESLTSAKEKFSAKKGFAWCAIPEDGKLNVTGKGAIYSWSLDSDPDNDNIPTSLEVVQGTDPNFSDTDRDAIPDDKDLFPLDMDNDGLNDDIEAFMGTSKTSFDTNSDAIADGLGQNGASRTELCMRISDRILPGAKYLDVVDPEMLSACRLFGHASLVVPFRDLVLSRNPEAVLDSFVSKAPGAYGILLDNCSVNRDYFSDPAFIDTYQIWAKKMWAEPDVDSETAFRLGQFITFRINEIIAMAQAKLSSKGMALAVSIPSTSSQSFSTWSLQQGLDRVIVIASDSDNPFQDGLQDGNMHVQKIFVHINEKSPLERTRAYISGVIASGSFRGTSSDSANSLQLAKWAGSEQTSLVQIATESTAWVPGLDKTSNHQDWLLGLYNQEMSARLCPIDNLGSAKVAFIDESTTYPTFDQTQMIALWIRQGGSLLVYKDKSRFDGLVWWGPRSSFGREISGMLGIKDLEYEKAMKAGSGTIMLTAVEPTNSIPRFFTDIMESVPKPPCYYCPPGFEAVEAGFVSSKFLLKQDLPRFPNPVFVPVEPDRFPYVAASTCPVPWVGRSDAKIFILAQSIDGLPTTVAIGLPGEPKAITSTRSFTSVYQNGILIVTFAGSSGGTAFAIDLSEALDLKSTSCLVSPTSFIYGDSFTIMATVVNVSKIPASQFSITFHIDSPVREKQIKRLIVPMLAPKQALNVSFEVPPIVEPGDHRIFAVVVAEGEINLSNNTTHCDFTVKPKARERKIEMQIGSTRATIDGKETTLSAPPFISSGKTMVPFRFVAEALDAKVSWDQFEKMVTIVKGDVTIYLWIGKTYAIVSGNMVTLTSPPVLKNGKTFVPMRFISESLRARVDWEPLTQTVTVSMVLNP